MQEVKLIPAWKRFIEKVKDLIIPRPLPPTGPSEKWEDEGGKSPAHAAMGASR